MAKDGCCCSYGATRHQHIMLIISALVSASYQASTLHGFAGFFDSRLFADVHISIVPKTFSEVSNIAVAVVAAATTAGAVG